VSDGDGRGKIGGQFCQDASAAVVFIGRIYFPVDLGGAVVDVPSAQDFLVSFHELPEKRFYDLLHDVCAS
jgi:hypothetical protein